MAPFIHPQHGRWTFNFRCAARGVRLAVRSQRDFAIHLPAAIVVMLAAAALSASASEWAALGLCVAVVLSAEMFNTALEHLARALTREENDEVRDALDAGSGAVLVVSLAAAVVGGMVLVHRLGVVLGWWSG